MTQPETPDAFIEHRLRSAMSNTCSSVYIVSSGSENESKNAITITSFTSVSVSPPLILFCVNKSSRFARLIERSDNFAINFIHNDQVEIAHLCSQSNIEEKFRQKGWLYKSGIPYLKDSNHVLFCDKTCIEEQGTHLVVYGSVKEVETENTKDSLLYYKREYAVIPDITTVL